MRLISTERGYFLLAIKKSRSSRKLKSGSLAVLVRRRLELDFFQIVLIDDPKTRRSTAMQNYKISVKPLNSPKDRTWHA